MIPLYHSPDAGRISGTGKPAPFDLAKSGEEVQRFYLIHQPRHPTNQPKDALHYSVQMWEHPPFPVSEELFCHCVAFLAKNAIVHNPIKSYLSAVRHLQISFGFADPFMASMSHLEQILRGIEVNQDQQGRNSPQY